MFLFGIIQTFRRSPCAMLLLIGWILCLLTLAMHTDQQAGKHQQCYTRVQSLRYLPRCALNHMMIMLSNDNPCQYSETRLEHSINMPLGAVEHLPQVLARDTESITGYAHPFAITIKYHHAYALMFRASINLGAPLFMIQHVVIHLFPHTGASLPLLRPCLGSQHWTTK